MVCGTGDTSGTRFNLVPFRKRKEKPPEGVAFPISAQHLQGKKCGLVSKITRKGRLL